MEGRLDMKKAVVLLSGGLDSTTLLYYVRSMGYKVYAVSFNYGQKHKKELKYAKDICKKLHIDHKIISLSVLNEIAPSALTRGNIEVPEGHYEDEVMKQTVVPNRNMVMLSLVTAYALGRNIGYMFYGAHSGDHEIYPDCRPEFILAMREAISLCDWKQVQFFAPFQHKSKTNIVTIGRRLGVPYEKTWSCLAKNTRVMTLRGPKEIQKLKDSDWVWGWKDGDFCPSRVEFVMNQGLKETYKLSVDNGVGKITELDVTGDHLVLMKDGITYKRVDELKRGDRLLPGWVKNQDVGEDNHYWMYHPKANWEQIDYLHRRASDFFGIKGECIHHIDKDGLKKIKMENHKVVDVKIGRVFETWDIQTSTQNFLLFDQGIFVHNCYKGGERPCLKCGTCVERISAFSKAGVKDPLLTPSEWKEGVEYMLKQEKKHREEKV